MSADTHHGPLHYVKIWGVLLVLLIISILGPELGIKAVTLITAFGIAFVKTYLVCVYFMHLNVEKKIVWYILGTMCLVVGLFYAGVAADVMKPTGQNWENKAALELIESHRSGSAEDESSSEH